MWLCPIGIGGDIPQSPSKPMPHQNAATIERKAQIPETLRTPGKDEAATVIDEMLEQRAWPIPMTELAEAAGYSRQHIANTLEDYYEPVEKATFDGGEENGETLTVEIPEGVDRQSYLEGFIDAYMRESVIV